MHTIAHKHTYHTHITHIIYIGKNMHVYHIHYVTIPDRETAQDHQCSGAKLAWAKLV